VHHPLPIDRRIGISTLCLGSKPLDEAIRLVREAGFGAFELVPHLYGGPEKMDRGLRRRRSLVSLNQGAATLTERVAAGSCGLATRGGHPPVESAQPRP
jgi:hypothetical protein